MEKIGLLKYFSFILLIYKSLCAVEEGNILLPMSSNFILAYPKNKINNKNYYTIPLKVGTPEKIFNVQVDTSTTTSWLPSVNCENCFGTENLYDSGESKTSSPTSTEIELQDEDGNVKGNKINDNIILGDYKLKQYGFIEVNKVDNEFRDHYEGKLGLGFKNNLDNIEFNFIEKLKYHNLIKRKIFTINEINENSGLLYIGDTPGKEYKTYCNISLNTDDFDDMYKESWICLITHVGIFNIIKGISNELTFYEEVKNTRFVSFDSAYDYIAVPISEKEKIERLIDEAELQCQTTENLNKNYYEDENNKDTLKNIFKQREVTISCKTTRNELIEKCLSLSFILQGHVYSIPLESLFSQTSVNGEMEMLIKYIDSKNAIWTFGYPFMSQFLIIFDMEDNRVGIKKLKKTILPLVDVSKEWEKWSIDNLDTETISSSNSSSHIGFGIFILIVIIVLLVLWSLRTIKKKSLESNGQAFDSEYNKERRVF